MALSAFIRGQNGFCVITCILVDASFWILNTMILYYLYMNSLFIIWFWWVFFNEFPRIVPWRKMHSIIITTFYIQGENFELLSFLFFIQFQSIFFFREMIILMDYWWSINKFWHFISKEIQIPKFRIFERHRIFIFHLIK